MVTFMRLLPDLGERYQADIEQNLHGAQIDVDVLEKKSCLCQESNYVYSVVLPLALCIILITVSRPCSSLTPGPQCLLRS